MRPGEVKLMRRDKAITNHMSGSDQYFRPPQAAGDFFNKPYQFINNHYERTLIAVISSPATTFVAITIWKRLISSGFATKKSLK